MRKLKVLDKDYVLSQTDNPKALKVALKRDKIKGIGLFANKRIKKGETIAYYRFRVFSLDGFRSTTDNMYTILVNTKSNNFSRNLIGDLDEGAILPARGDTPYWAYFSNEPSGKQTSNAYIDPNLRENYRHKSRMSPGDYMVYRLKASRTIEPGEEIVWCYGDMYLRNYKANC